MSRGQQQRRTTWSRNESRFLDDTIAHLHGDGNRNGHRNENQNQE